MSCFEMQQWNTPAFSLGLQLFSHFFLNSTWILSPLILLWNVKLWKVWSSILKFSTVKFLEGKDLISYKI